MNSFLVRFFFSFAGLLLEKRDLFSIFEFLFSENRKKNIRVGEFLTGSVWLPETFLFFFFCLTVWEQLAMDHFDPVKFSHHVGCSQSCSSSWNNQCGLSSANNSFRSSLFCWGLWSCREKSLPKDC